MGGIIYAVFRSIRGLPTTIERVTRGRGWGGVSHELFPLHAVHGIAPDGSPTGIEHALVYLGTWGPVLQLRARWYDRAAARRFRELLLADQTDHIGFSIAGPFQRFKERPPDDVVPYPAIAFDLDVIHTMAAASEDGQDLQRRIQRLPREALLAPYALPAEPFRAAFDAQYNNRAIEHPPISDPTERALVDEMVKQPSDPGPAHVYADWLDDHGRSDEASVLRPLIKSD